MADRPDDVTGDMWLAGRKVFETEATRFNEADRYEIASAIADRAPEKIWVAMQQAGWMSADTAPTGDELFLAYAPPDDRFPQGRTIIVRGSIFVTMRAQATPDHLRFPATHWMLMPAPPVATAESST